MLRSYFSRVCGELPPVTQASARKVRRNSIEGRGQPEQKASHEGEEGLYERKAAGWNLKGSRTANRQDGRPGGHQYKSWLVTDFVTLGKARLSHAYFLMCLGKSHDELKTEFCAPGHREGVSDLPPKAPRRRRSCSRSVNPQNKTRQVHNGALFWIDAMDQHLLPDRADLSGEMRLADRLGPIFRPAQSLISRFSTLQVGRGRLLHPHRLLGCRARNPTDGTRPTSSRLRDASRSRGIRGSANKLVERGVDAPGWGGSGLGLRPTASFAFLRRACARSGRGTSCARRIDFGRHLDELVGPSI